MRDERHLTQQDAEDVALFHQRADGHRHHVPDARPWVRHAARLGEGLLHILHHPRHQPASQLGDQGLLVGEEVVKRADADARLLGDAVGGEFLIAAPRQKPSRGIQHGVETGLRAGLFRPLFRFIFSHLSPSPPPREGGRSPVFKSEFSE